MFFKGAHCFLGLNSVQKKSDSASKNYLIRKMNKLLKDKINIVLGDLGDDM